jgi:hypothetical protein
LDIDAKPLVDIQTDYNLQTAKQNESFAERLANIRKAVAIF